jgi:hypothetical protein
MCRYGRMHQPLILAYAIMDDEEVTNGHKVSHQA